MKITKRQLRKIIKEAIEVSEDNNGFWQHVWSIAENEPDSDTYYNLRRLWHLKNDPYWVTQSFGHYSSEDEYGMTKLVGDSQHGVIKKQIAEDWILSLDPYGASDEQLLNLPDEDREEKINWVVHNWEQLPIGPFDIDDEDPRSWEEL